MTRATRTATTGVAIVGCGLVGTKRAAGLGARRRLVTVYDPDLARARRLSDSVDPRPSVASDLESLVGADGVDLVVVATPHDELARVATAAATAGRHVLIEKPGARTASELDAVAAAAARTGVVVRVGFNHRFHPAVLELRRLIECGVYGRIMNVRARYGHGGRVGYERDWRADRDRSGGGELIDQGIHLLDLTRFLAGDCELAFAETRTDFWDMEVEDNAFLALRLAAGGFAWLHASWTEWKNLFSLEVALERAKLEITGLGGSYGTETLVRYEMSEEMGPPAVETSTWNEPDSSWAAELDDVIGAINGAVGVGADLDDASASLRIVAEAYGP